LGDTPVHWVGHTASPAAVVTLVRLAAAVPGEQPVVAQDVQLEAAQDEQLAAVPGEQPVAAQDAQLEAAPA
jgi:hypothetical protein